MGRLFFQFAYICSKLYFVGVDRAVSKFLALFFAPLVARVKLVTFVVEFHQQQTILPVASRENKAYSD